MTPEQKLQLQIGSLMWENIVLRHELEEARKLLEKDDE
jgi:hypothetical protein